LANVSNETAGKNARTSPPKQQLSWGEKRDRRRRRRRVFEETLAWILVPALIYVGYLIVQGFGGIPKELVDFASEVWTALAGGRF
jgi:hypothetical protein